MTVGVLSHASVGATELGHISKEHGECRHDKILSAAGGDSQGRLISGAFEARMQAWSQALVLTSVVTSALVSREANDPV